MCGLNGCDVFWIPRCNRSHTLARPSLGRQLKSRRGSKKSPQGSSQRGLAISAGDCADWVPNSERDTCLHCEK